MKTLRSLRFTTVVAVSMLAPSCTGTGESEGGDGKQDSLGCLVDKSGRGGALGSLNDPIANLVLKPAGSACAPDSFTTLMAKLREVDNLGDDGAACDADERIPVRMAPVSERTQLLNDPKQPARSVFTRECGGRDEFELFLAPLKPVQIDDIKANGLPGDVEIMALDKQRGVYNFYAIREGQWHFFGDSLDMRRRRAEAGPVKSGEHLDPALECARCHEGGGPVMKELQQPWNNWPNFGYEGEKEIDFPGETELNEAVARALGENAISQMDGRDVEERVRRGNRVWNITRVRELRASGDLAALLEPLFCSVEVNLLTSEDEPGDPNVDPSDAFYYSTEFLSGSDSFFVELPSADYNAAVKRIGQHIPDTNKIDTLTRLMFAERSGADDDYVTRLTGRAFDTNKSDIDGPEEIPPEVGDDQSPAVIDVDFVRDVMMVDATRPVFSDARCQLRQLVPELDPSQITPEGVRKAFIKALEAKSNRNKHESELLANLKNRDDGNEDTGAHAVRIANFEAACEARPVAEYMQDIIKLAVQKRVQYRLRHPDIVEAPELLPVTNIDDKLSADAHLDPVTCTCVNCGE